MSPSPKSPPPKSASDPAATARKTPPPKGSTSRRTSPPRPASPRPGGNQARSAASARARLAAEQARQQRRRRQLLAVVVPLAVVLVAVAALVVVRVTGLGRSEPTAAGVAGSGVVQGVTSVPAGVLDQVGVGTMKAAPRSITGPALTADGKPKVLYVGAEYCPYCAGERWAMVVALSRFGTFSGLGQTSSSSTDVYPDTATLSFHGSTFTSSTVAFTGVETEDRKGAELDQLSAEDQQTFATYDAPPNVPEDSKGAIPFVDIGGRYMISGASYDVSVLKGKTHAEIAAALSDPTSEIARAVDGSANAITAAICASTDGKPSAVCTSAGVQAAAKTLS